MYLIILQMKNKRIFSKSFIKIEPNEKLGSYLLSIIYYCNEIG